jgi:hypothetical protein
LTTPDRRDLPAPIEGATVVVVQRMLGHSSPTVTLDVYSHLFADDLDTVAARLHEAKVGHNWVPGGYNGDHLAGSNDLRRGNKCLSVGR